MPRWWQLWALPWRHTNQSVERACGRRGGHRSDRKNRTREPRGGGDRRVWAGGTGRWSLPAPRRDSPGHARARAPPRGLLAAPGTIMTDCTCTRTGSTPRFLTSRSPDTTRSTLRAINSLPTWSLTRGTSGSSLASDRRFSVRISGTDGGRPEPRKPSTHRVTWS